MSAVPEPAVSEPAGPEPAAYVLIIHEVADYPKWKAVFDNAAPLRKAAGEIEYRLLAYEAEERRIVHFSRWTSLGAARAFFESPELVEIRRIAGVRSPEFIHLNEIETGRL